MMDRYGFLVKILLLGMTCVATLCAEMPTHLISVDYSAYPYDDSKSPDADAVSQESVKIENRQLYDTVKHASGYDPDAAQQLNSTTREEATERLNSSSVKIFIPSRKSSAVIQAIPRKVRGPGSISIPTTSTSRPQSLHTTAKDYGTGEPTTTIVYATSIPTTPSRTYVNIRPVPLLSTQKYRSTVVEAKLEKDAPKPVIEKFDEDEQQQEKKEQVNVVLEKPAFKIDSSPERVTTAPGLYDPPGYHVEQRKRNLYKSVPYAKVRSNENNRNTFMNPYPNHKWTADDYMPRPSSPPPPQFVYENHQNPTQSYYHPGTRYPPPDEYPDDMYRVPPPMVFIPQQQTTTATATAARQQYQPLTVRDFDLLLQLLVLRERRLNTAQEPYPPPPPPADYAAGQDPNYFYDKSAFYKPRNVAQQPPSARLLPSNVREELLFRMLLLALNLQPQPKPLRAPAPVHIPPQYMYLGPQTSPGAAAQQSFLEFRQREGTSSSGFKNPVRSVQVLGEID